MKKNKKIQNHVEKFNMIVLLAAGGMVLLMVGLLIMILFTVLGHLVLKLWSIFFGG
jgi:hypothetical protein